MARSQRTTGLLVKVAFLCFMVATGAAFAGVRPKTNITHVQRVDLRNLGYPMVNEIPANSCYITSLLTASDGRIYGATSGEQAYLFVFDPKTNKVRHLGKIADEVGVHHSLVEDKSGRLYVGTGKNIFDEFEMSKYGPKPGSAKDLINWKRNITGFDKNYPDHVRYEMELSGGVIGYEYVDLILWNDIKNYFNDYPGGRLYRYDPVIGDKKVKLADMDCELEDLGAPVAKNSIYALTINPAGDVIYGLTYPDGHFFVYDIGIGKFKDLGPIDNEITFHGPERHWRSLPRALVCDDKGRVYTSSTDGLLKFYDPQSGRIESTHLAIPNDDYHAHTYTDYAVVEYFDKDRNGLIYGGSSDGYLFSFDPEKNELVNLGKVRGARRLRCLVVANDGKVYMMAGERAVSKPCQLYSYDPATGGFTDLGLLRVDRSPYYRHEGFQFDSTALGIDGTIYFGESDRRGKLFMYIP